MGGSILRHLSPWTVQRSANIEMPVGNPNSTEISPLLREMRLLPSMIDSKLTILDVFRSAWLLTRSPFSNEGWLAKDY
jgi:hypothetical protein